MHVCVKWFYKFLLICDTACENQAKVPNLLFFFFNFN